jgi:hypothetical protein
LNRKDGKDGKRTREIRVFPLFPNFLFKNGRNSLGCGIAALVLRLCGSTAVSA